MNSEHRVVGHTVKDVTGKIALLLLSLLICAFIGEFAIRMLLKEKVTLFPRYHTDAHYGEFTLRRLVPNAVFWHTSVDGQWKFTTNSQGFRNVRDIPYEKPQGTVRILSLGDSQTQGFEVRQEYTFSSIMQRYLEKHGINAEVINAGVSGFGTAEELVFLENEGIKYQPDIVVLGFYANDLDDNIKAGIFTLRDGRLAVSKKEHIPGVNILNLINEFSVLRWLSENSYLYSFGLNTVWEVAKKTLLNKEKLRLQTEYAVPTEKADDYQIALSARLIQRMYAFCQQNKMILIILDLPCFALTGECFVQNGVIQSSIPTELLPTVKTNNDIFISSKELLADYIGIGELHRPHGQNHISEFTHLIYGIELARRIIETSPSKVSAKTNGGIKQ